MELQYRKPFLDIWREEKDDSVLGPLSERMGVRSRTDGSLLVSDEELEAASMFALPSFISFFNLLTDFSLPARLLSWLLLLQSLDIFIWCAAALVALAPLS